MRRGSASGVQIVITGDRDGQRACGIALRRGRGGSRFSEHCNATEAFHIDIDTRRTGLRRQARLSLLALLSPSRNSSDVGSSLPQNARLFSIQCAPARWHGLNRRKYARAMVSRAGAGLHRAARGSLRQAAGRARCRRCGRGRATAPVRHARKGTPGPDVFRLKPTTMAIPFNRYRESQSAAADRARSEAELGARRRSRKEVAAQSLGKPGC
jgi:hypothetical protein